MDAFVNLHTHTDFSNMDAFITCDKLAKKIKEIGQPGCAITDHGNTNGWVVFDEACGNSGIKPLFGCEFYYVEDINKNTIDEKTKLKITRGVTKKNQIKKIIKEYEKKHEIGKRSHLLVLAKDKIGYSGILEMTSIAFDKGLQNYGNIKFPTIDYDIIKKYSGHLIVTSACLGGQLNRYLMLERYEKAYNEAKKYKETFGDDYYLEIQPLEMEEQKIANIRIYNLARELGIEMVVGADVHYVNKNDYVPHDALLCIKSSYKHKLVKMADEGRFTYNTKILYVKTRRQIFNLFNEYHRLIKPNDVSRALDNTVRIFRKCNVVLNKGFKITPEFKFPDEFENQYDYLKKLCMNGWKNKYVKDFKRNRLTKTDLGKRLVQLKYELGQIKKQGFVNYFLIVWDLIKNGVIAKGIERGPARGSSCGSIVAYLLDITTIDPLKYGLLFSRFIDPERTDNPDIDLDFEDKRRWEVKQYLFDKYGYDRVALLGNNIKFKGKLVLRDCARIFGIKEKEVGQITDLISVKLGDKNKLGDFLKEFPVFQRFKDKYNDCVNAAINLEGQIRNYGVHAAGVIITDKPFYNYFSVRYEYDKESGKKWPVANIDKRDCEKLGLLKIDILGLSVLSIISETKKLINARV